MYIRATQKGKIRTNN